MPRGPAVSPHSRFRWKHRRPCWRSEARLLRQEGAVPRQCSCSSLAKAASLARRATAGCTERTHRRSAAKENCAFGPNSRIREKQKLGVHLAVVASLVRRERVVGGRPGSRNACGSGIRAAGARGHRRSHGPTSRASALGDIGPPVSSASRCVPSTGERPPYGDLRDRRRPPSRDLQSSSRGYRGKESRGCPNAEASRTPARASQTALIS